jgi:hypothetical protein
MYQNGKPVFISCETGSPDILSPLAMMRVFYRLLGTRIVPCSFSVIICKYAGKLISLA